MQIGTYIILEPVTRGFPYRYLKVLDDQGTLQCHFYLREDGLFANDTSGTLYRLLYEGIAMNSRARKIAEYLNKIDFLEKNIDRLLNTSA